MRVDAAKVCAERRQRHSRVVDEIWLMWAYETEVSRVKRVWYDQSAATRSKLSYMSFGAFVQGFCTIFLRPTHILRSFEPQVSMTITDDIQISTQLRISLSKSIRTSAVATVNVPSRRQERIRMHVLMFVKTYTNACTYFFFRDIRRLVARVPDTPRSL
jgi:hypothetical protein